MFLVAGLGNPSSVYKITRHNAGFMAVNFISDNSSFAWGDRLKFNASVTSGDIGEHKVILCKPMNFMNLSGNSIFSLMSYYKIESKRLIVIHDDIDLSFGEVKCKIGGGSGGHNGLKSIDKFIGPNYYRIRLGIGRPVNSNLCISDYVLSNFSNAELNILNTRCNNILKNINLLFLYRLEQFKIQIAMAKK